MNRTRSFTARLMEHEWEWFRRHAHWAGEARSDLFRSYLRELIREEGYLRPPDDEPQDFGYEKEMMEFVQSVDAD